MSVCDEETPFDSGEAFVEHLQICPNKYPRGCNKLVVSQLYYAGLPSFHKQISKAIKKINEQYNYMLTFTVDLKKKSISTDDDIKEIEDYIIKLISSRSLNHIVKSHIVYEIGSNGNHHWHVYANCTKCLKKQRFQTYIKKYGNVDISRSKTNNTDEIINYMSKDGIPKVIK